MINLTYNITKTALDINFHKVSRPVLSWREEVKNTAIYIRNSTDKEIFIATSGGVDAEVACRGFIDAGIPFRMFIVEFDNGKNAHDTAYAHKFASMYNIETIVHKINMEKFLNVDIYQYVEQGYTSVLPYRYFQIYLLEQIEKLGGCGIIGSGDVFLVSKDTEVCLSYEPEYFLATDWCKNNKLVHYPTFHLTTPELTLAYLNHPVTQFMSSDYRYSIPKDQQINFNPAKIILYHAEYQDMERRKKFHGWENMLTLWLDTKQKLSNLFPNQPSIDITVEQAINQLTPQ